jgi:hypothetical protein
VPLRLSGNKQYFQEDTENEERYLIPTPALPGSGSMGMISACSFKAPLINSAKLKVNSSKLHFEVYNSGFFLNW